MTTRKPLYLSIDVGTGSVRAALFSSSGEKHSYSSAPIATRNPRADHYEQSTSNIWRSLVTCIQAVIKEAGLDTEQCDRYIASVGIDATCSLVLCYDDGLLTPVPLSDCDPADQADSVVDTDDVYNIILWLDKRAVDDAAFINQLAEGNDDVQKVLSQFGGKISPENQPPKIRWLCRNYSQRFRSNNILFFDLSDWLVAKMTGCANINARSTCTLACKWGWNDHQWNDRFWSALGLQHLCERNYRAIGNPESAQYPGRQIALLESSVASECGLSQAEPCVVAAPLIDAYAGSVWALGIEPSQVVDSAIKSSSEHQQADASVVSFVCGTSTCVLQVNHDPIFVPGVWGPFKHALIPGWHVTEGGQSVTGKLLQHVVHNHPAYKQLKADFGDDDNAIFSHLTSQFDQCKYAIDDSEQDPATHVHFLDHHAGNRSPLADPTVRGVHTGISLDTKVADLAVQFRASVQALCYGGKRILEALTSADLPQASIVAACGGMCKNNLFLTELADSLQVPIALCQEPDTVLLGCAVLARMAHENSDDMAHTARQMSKVGKVIQPNRHRVQYHSRKYKVYKKLHQHYLEYREIMSG